VSAGLPAGRKSHRANKKNLNVNDDDKREDTAQPASPGEDADAPVNWTPPKKHPLTWVAIAVLAIIAIACILAVWGIWPFSGVGPQTDNSYVQGRTTVIAPQTTGYVTQVYVSDYAQVRKGQVLLEIDAATYRAHAMQSSAQVEVARANLANNAQQQASAAAQLAGQQASLEKAEATLRQTSAELRRATDLVSDGSVSLADLDMATANYHAARSALAQTRAQIRIAQENLKTAQVDRAQLAAQLDAAQAGKLSTDIDLGRTRIVAPEDGQIGRVTIHLGQLVASGSQLFTLIPPGAWVIANYKESQIADVRLGQRASFTVDALGDARLRGTVTRIAPATAAEFSAVSPSNAVGNFVKIPQRIGIRIEPDAHQPLATRLRPGMSVETTIDTSGVRVRGDRH
jgi:multidrug resistance efflux pump